MITLFGSLNVLNLILVIAFTICANKIDLDQIEEKGQRYCGSCKKIVYLVNNVEDYVSHIQHGDCIAYYEEIDQQPTKSYNRFPLFEPGVNVKEKQSLFGINSSGRRAVMGRKCF